MKKRRRILKTEKEIENFLSCSYMLREKKTERERAIEEKDRNLEKESYLPLIIVICILVISKFITVFYEIFICISHTQALAT